MSEVRRYNFKLYPNKAQEAALERQTVLLAQLWNAALEQRETQWRHECQRNGKGERKGISRFDQQKELKVTRANDPEYEAMAASTLELTIRALDDAFKAFFRRVKQGAGKSSGYPRFKASKPADKDWRSYHHDTIWHRDHRKGWRLDRAGKHWRIYTKGIPGTIRARGKFPANIDSLDIRDMRIMRRDNAWFCSVVVRMEARREAGKKKLEIDFDLIDEFVTVKTVADGQCLPGWEGVLETSDEQISPENHGVNKASAAEAPEMGANDRHGQVQLHVGRAAEAPEMGANDRTKATSPSRRSAAEAPESGGDGKNTDSETGRFADAPGEDRIKRANHSETEKQDDIQSEADQRFKKFSWRWRQSRKRIARRKAKQARRTKERLHLLTTRLVEQSSEILVVCPPIREATKSAKGNERNHGAAVKPVAQLNRHILGQAPATAIQMLEYKAKEAGIPFARIEPDEHAVAIGRDLPVATKAVRSARREMRKAA